MKKKITNQTMKELNSTESFELLEVIKHIKVPNAPGKTGNNKIIEHVVIQTVVYTDGIIADMFDESVKDIEEYYIGETKYEDVDTLKLKKVLLKDYTYIVVYTIANEKSTVGNVSGYFDIIKNVNIYLKNINDVVALKKARDLIESMQVVSKKVDYSSLTNFVLSSNTCQLNSYEEVVPKVYLKKN